MWQQLFSYTPSGKLELKRLFFRTEGATFDDVREAHVHLEWMAQEPRGTAAGFRRE